MEPLTATAREAAADRGLLRAAAAALGLALWMAAAHAGAGPRGEYEVKVAFLVHFARLVEWPDSAPEDEPFVIGVLGVPEAVREGPRESHVSGRPVLVRRIAGADQVGGCRIVFVAAAERERTREMLAAAAQDVLTVGEAEGFLEDGGMIRFFEDDRKIRFEIEPSAAEAAGLRISSRLLRLARRAKTP